MYILHLNTISSAWIAPLRYCRHRIINPNQHEQQQKNQLYLLFWDPPESLAMTPVVCATLLVRALVSTTLKYRQFVLVSYSPVKLVSFWKVTQLVQFILIQSGKDTDRDFNSMKALTSVACLRLRKMYACFLLLSIGRAVGRVQLLFLVFTYPNWDIVYL